ncbi:multidrug and toxin extrusion protein 1-like isoform X2 [Pseudoliparis swirei]|uniref:multidrug and toxin extrusion protein 1-like isoform X2 n=1 Tax=Pseudoliparis swirei TaxID=2059687 RepID=UPI0024BD8DDE|nr:multidrug and toxin extrusion protein 1-like isoform X2 [Pseudoliparis swirei]
MEKPDSPDTARPSPPGAGLADDEVPVATAARAEGAVSSKLFRCACVRRWLPLAYREELYHVVLLTWPVLLSRMLNFLQQFVIGVFCGHIGNAELAGYALASATFGSGNMKRVGVILQRSSLILLLFCLPCWGLLINTQNLLLIMHQEHEVARIAQIYVMAFIPAVPAMYLLQLQVSYLQNQGITQPQMYTAAAANVVNLGANYVLIHSLEMGVIGSAIANSLCQITSCLLLYGYIRWKKLHLPTWGGWSTACLQDWGSYMKLAIPSTLMVCFDWWVWDIGGFLAGVLGELDLAAQQVMLEVAAITFMFPLGFHVAACVRVGNALGAGNPATAIITCKVSLVMSGALAVFQGIVIMSTKNVIGYIFTTDEKIVEIVSVSLIVYTFLQFFDAILCVCSGILIGAGMQKIAALSNLVCCYCIGLPVGIALMFPAKLRILGLWLGILTCVFFEMSFFLFLIFKLNWKKLSYKAQLRAGKKMVVIPTRRGSTLLGEAVVPDTSDFPETAQLDGKEAPKTEGYSPVNSQDQELKAGHEANNTNTGRAEADAESTKKTSSTKTAALLSVTELILRRGFVFLVSVLILLTGVACHIAFPVQEASTQSRFNLTQNWTNDSSLTTLTPQDLTLKLGL